MQRKTHSHKKDSKATHTARPSNDNAKKGNASATTDCKRTMETLAGECSNAKDPIALEREGVSGSVLTQADGRQKRQGQEETLERDPLEDDIAKRRKKEDKEIMGKPAVPPRRGVGRKVPGASSKTSSTTPLPKSLQSGHRSGKATSHGKGSKEKSSSTSSHSRPPPTSSKRTIVEERNPITNSEDTESPPSHVYHLIHRADQSKSERSKSLGSKSERKRPVSSRLRHRKDSDDDDDKPLERSLKVPPLKIVLPGGSGAGGRSEHEGEGHRGGGKGRGGSASLPYVIPSTVDSDHSDGNDDKRVGEGKVGQRVLRSHKLIEDKEKLNKSSRGHDHDHGSSKNDAELHPRKRKLKSSKEHREPKAEHHDSANAIPKSNPYQMYIHIRKQIDHRQKLLFPVKPKPPKDFNKYLMNRCTYTLQGNVEPEPPVEIPPNLPAQMVSEYLLQEKERTRLRIQQLVEKEKLVLAVEQEILRVHGRAERAVANQSLPFSVCTLLRDNEVYNVLAPEQEEKRNAQRSRCNGRQINSWLQEVDDKWEKIKEGMLRRQNTEAQTLHAVQIMGWEWKLKEIGVCDFKTAPKIDTKHVPQIHVANFDLPA